MKTNNVFLSLVMTVTGIVLIVAGLGIATYCAATSARGAQPDEMRAQKLQESIERLTNQREQVRQELIAAKEELRAVRQEMAAQTNEVIITIKVAIPPQAHKPQVKVEQE